jgi:phytoene desaturase (3,4-didehydrolycopene-forming)
MYMGMSPFDAPATYTLLQYAEYAKGVFYPIGGFQTLVAAFEKVATGFGSKFIYNTSVTKIIVQDEKGGISARVRGVELEGGEKIMADVVVSNADLIWTYNNLLPPSPYAKKLQKKKQTCSSISFYWGTSEKIPELGMHNVRNRLCVLFYVIILIKPLSADLPRTRLQGVVR